MKINKEITGKFKGFRTTQRNVVRPITVTFTKVWRLDSMDEAQNVVQYPNFDRVTLTEEWPIQM